MEHTAKCWAAKPHAAPSPARPHLFTQVPPMSWPSMMATLRPCGAHTRSPASAPQLPESPGGALESTAPLQNAAPTLAASKLRTHLLHRVQRRAVAAHAGPDDHQVVVVVVAGGSERQDRPAAADSPGGPGSPASA